MTAQKSEFLMLFTALLLVCSAMLPPPVTVLLAALSLVAAIAVLIRGHPPVGRTRKGKAAVDTRGGR
jgi:hypothetical protein